MTSPFLYIGILGLVIIIIPILLKLYHIRVARLLGSSQNRVPNYTDNGSNTIFTQLAVNLKIIPSPSAKTDEEENGKIKEWINNNIPGYQSDRRLVKRTPLSQREKEVVQGLVDGLSYKEIAQRLNISTGTIQTHIKKIYKKLHVHSKVEVITKSLQNKI